jgi:hypothetical protein
MFCKKMCRDITIRLVTINFQSCIPYYVTPCIMCVHSAILHFLKIHKITCSLDADSPDVFHIACLY